LYITKDSYAESSVIDLDSPTVKITSRGSLRRNKGYKKINRRKHQVSVHIDFKQVASIVGHGNIYYNKGVDLLLKRHNRKPTWKKKLSALIADKREN
jgi:hypothetical protein